MAEWQIIDRIQEVCLANTIASYETIQLMREHNIGLLDVLIIDDGYSLKNHVIIIVWLSLLSAKVTLIGDKTTLLGVKMKKEAYKFQSSNKND